MRPGIAEFNKEVFYTDNLESRRCDLACPRLKKTLEEEESFSGAYSIYTYQRWERLIIASFPYMVILITSPLPPLLHISLGFAFNPLDKYSTRHTISKSSGFLFRFANTVILASLIFEHYVPSIHIM